MAIQEQDRILVEEKREAKENVNEQQKVVVVTGPYRFPESAPWWRGTTSPLGMIFISVIVMVALVSFGIGASQTASGTNGQSDVSASTTSASSQNGMSMNTFSAAPKTKVPNATQSYGNQLAKYVIDPDGAKHFTFTAQQVMWEVVKGHRVLAYAINGMVPGPMIHVTAGDHIRVTFINHFPEATAIHWHGLQVSSAEDGVPGVGQPPIQPGKSYLYDFTVHDQDIGTHWYHSHYNDLTQVAGGFYGAFIVDPRPGTIQAKQAIHADVDVMQFISTMSGYYVINGKSFPDTQPIIVKHGQTVRMRLVGADTIMMHPYPYASHEPRSNRQ